MSKLSELLNPAPNDDAPASSPRELHDPSHSTEIRGDKNQPADEIGHLQLSSPPQQPSIESPLEALAFAATNSIPMLSPTNQLGSPHGSAAIPAPFNLSPRSVSTRISPPHPLDLSRQTDHPLGAFSAGLEQYHHPSGREGRLRRLSDVTNSAPSKLPPLKTSPSHRDSLFPVNIQALQQPAEATSWDNHHELDQISRAPHSIQDSEPNHDQSIIHETEKQCGMQASENSWILPDSPLPQSRAIGVEIKAEASDHTVVLQNTEDNNIHHKVANRHSIEPNTAVHRSTPDLNVAEQEESDPTGFKSDGLMPETPVDSKPTVPKKRGPPKSKVEKKGTASTIKPPSKRRKIESSSANGTPSLQRSGTPASSRASKTPAPRNRKRESATPAGSPSIVTPDEDEEEEEGSELFCICRKPDDHTWMIACDGDCQDWFHGRCVGIDERDGKLIDKYICMSNQCHEKKIGALV